MSETNRSEGEQPMPSQPDGQGPTGVMNTALVLFSGGQDSATCLAWARARFDAVATVGFDYGQIHGVEMQCREVLLERLNPSGEDTVLDLGIINALAETALTHDMEIRMANNGLPNTFVPARNILFLTCAAMLAYRRGIDHLVAGVCQTDYSGYPDCRDDFVKAQQVALNLGMETRLTIHTPLMHLTKAETWALAHDLGGDALVELIRSETHTCYRGTRDTLHPWGYGCGDCPACALRAKGWAEWRRG